jgi:hypothetical protein
MDMPFLMNLPISARLRAKVEAQGKGRGQAAPMAACIDGCEVPVLHEVKNAAPIGRLWRGGVLAI